LSVGIIEATCPVNYFDRNSDRLRNVEESKLDELKLDEILFKVKAREIVKRESLAPRSFLM